MGWPTSEAAANAVPEPGEPNGSPLAQALAAELAAPPREHAGESTAAASTTGLLTQTPRKGWRRFFGGVA